MNENDFKLNLGKILERKFLKKEDVNLGIDFIDVYTSIPDCNVSFEYTGLFTRREWNTYRAIIHFQCGLGKIDVFEKYSEVILSEASSLFGKQDDYYLTDISIEPKMEKFDVFDFSELGLNETLRRAIGDASIFIGQGKYSSCIDRVHTAIHGYLRSKLDDLEVSYEESDMMPKLFNLLYREWETLNNSDLDDMMLKALRSASATLDVLNDIRNRHSLAHPNDNIIGENEAKLVLGLAESISRYINKRNFKSN